MSGNRSSEGISRRSFLKRTLALAAGVGGAGILAACAATPTPAAPAAAPTTAPAAAAPTKPPAAAPTTAPASVSKGMKGKITVLNREGFDPLQTATETMPKTPKMMLTLRDEYKKLNPDAEIEFIKWPGLEYWNTTLNTWLAGQTAPDVFPLYYHLAAQMFQKGQIENMEPYLSKPNPYIEKGKPGSEKWFDMFVPNYGATKAPDGNHYTVIFDAIWVATFYDKDAFDKVGVKAPTTWAELIDVCKKFKAAGITPYASIGPWILAFMSSMLWSDIAKQMRMTPTTEWKEITAEEMTRAYKKGILTPQMDIWKEVHRLYQELATFMTPGGGAYAKDYFISSDLDRVFLTGKAPMHYYYGNFGDILNNDKNKKWNYDHFWVPTITKDSSKFATGYKVGSVIFQGQAHWAVPTFSKNKDLAIDWLMFISKPENISRVVDDGTAGTFTMVNGYSDPRYPAFKEQLDLGFYYIGPNTYGGKIGTDYNFRLRPELHDGRMTVDQFANAVDQLIKDNIDQLIADNKWDTSKW